MANYKNIILVLTGLRGSGKTTIASNLVTRFNFSHIEMSSVIKELRERDNLSNYRLRKYVDLMHIRKSRHFAIKHLINNNLLNSQRLVVTGMRNIQEIDYLKNTFKDYKIVSIYLLVPFVFRYFRVIKRNDRNNFCEFFVEEFYSIKWGNNKIKSNSFIIKNFSLEFTMMKIKQYIF